MTKILLPYVKEHQIFKKCKFLLEKYTPKDVEIIYIKDEKRKGMSVMINPYFDGKDDLIIWHSDLMATPEWYDKLKLFVELNSACGIFGMKLVYPNGLIQHYGGWIRADGVCFHPHQGCIDYGFTETQLPAFVTWGRVLIRKEVIQKIGKIDEQFEQTYYGDVDYCMRAREANFLTCVVPIKLIHEESLDTKQNKTKLNELLMKNHHIFIAKWMSVLAGVINNGEG